MDWREQAAFSSAEQDYLTEPEPEVGECGVCGGTDHENNYVEDLDQWLCNMCDVEDMEQ